MDLKEALVKCLLFIEIRYGNNLGNLIEIINALKQRNYKVSVIVVALLKLNISLDTIEKALQESDWANESVNLTELFFDYAELEAEFDDDLIE